jgi:hypothetical protein
MSRAELLGAAGGPPLPDAPARPRSARPPDPAPSESPLRLVPDADGLVDLTGVGRPEPVEAVPNPFRLRYRPAGAVREVPFAVASVLVGARPRDAAAIINGAVCSPGDTVEGMTIAGISADGLDLERGGLRILLPLSDRPLRLRLAP